MIDLKNVINNYPECLDSASKFKSYMLDLYPDNVFLFLDLDNVCRYVYRIELERLKEKYERFQKRNKNQTY